MIARSVQSPRAWFLLQWAVLGVAIALSGRLSPVRVPDTASYEAFSFASWHDALSAPRTLGYPLYLRLTGWLDRAQRLAPAGHFLLQGLAVCVMWRALAAWGWSAWSGLIVASSLFYTNVFLRYVHTLAPDCLAASCAIAATGGLLLVVARPRRPRNWVLLTVMVLGTYQLRPAYLFVPLLMPALGGALHWLWADGPRRAVRSAALAAALGVACGAPLLAFALLRFWIVGQFGPVAFGGISVAGVVSSFVTAADVDRMPAAVQPLAGAIARRRQWQAARTPGFPAQPTSSYMAMEGQFDASAWEVCVPAARAQCGEDWPAINRGLLEYAAAVIRCRPGAYGNWLAKAFVRGWYMIVSELIMNPLDLTAMLLLCALQAVLVVRLKRSPAPVPRRLPDRSFWEFNTLALISLSFAFAKVVFVMLTTPPLGRFMDAAGMFLPLALMQACVHRVELIRTVGRARAGDLSALAPGRSGQSATT